MHAAARASFPSRRLAGKDLLTQIIKRIGDCKAGYFQIKQLTVDFRL
jgi:hypothetical protein